MTSGGASFDDSAFFNLVERTFFEFYKYRGVNAYHTSHNFALKPQILEILCSLGPLWFKLVFYEMLKYVNWLCKKILVFCDVRKKPNFNPKQVSL